MPDPVPALPEFATVESDTLIARCADRQVHVRPLDSGVVQLRYAIADEPTPGSWAVGAVARDPAATFAGEGDQAAAITAAMTILVDATCRVTVRRADGSAVLADAEPFAAGPELRLVRLAGADRVYGLGERTGGLDKRGRAWTFWNTDAYDPALGGWQPDQDPLYQSIPFEIRFAGGAAFGIFTDETRRMVFDLGASDPARDTIAATGARTLTQYLIAGPRMPDVVERYTRLTGRPAMPPRWALGFHQSRWGYPDGATVEAVAARFRSEGIPADTLWLDIQHMRGFRSFTIDESRFPLAMLDRLRAQGFRTIAIADPGIKVDPGWDVFDSGLAGDHFLRLPDGELFQGTAWPGASAFPDFSRPATRDWWRAQVATLSDRGIAGIWLDVNEPTTFPEGGGGTTVPDELAVDGDGAPTTMAALHNAYALFQSRATFDALAATGTRPFVLSRAGYAGIQRHAAVWTGDTPSTWDGLAQTLPMLLGLGVSGVPLVGSDIGGYSGHATAELYARWLALGSISPFARAHVTNDVPGQEPWMFGPEITQLAREQLGERYRLLPYLYSLADEAARTGAPMLRPLVWEFPDDPSVADLGDQAMLGPWILVAPVVEPGATSRRVYLPAGRWYELHSSAIVDGPTTIDVPLSIAALPMFVREGAIIPRWPTATTSAPDPSTPLELNVYPSARATSFTLYEDDGERSEAAARTTLSLAALADGARLAWTREGATPSRTVTVRVHRVDGEVHGVDAAPATYDDNARVLTATVTDAPARELRFRYDPAIADASPPVTITFEVRVPDGTPTTSPIHVATSANGWTHAPLAWVGPNVARGTLVVPRGAWLDYKITRGTWDSVEKLAGCGEAPNRHRIGAAGTRVDTVGAWRDRCP